MQDGRIALQFTHARGEMTPREPGYYWIWNGFEDRWQAADWDGKHWRFAEMGHPHKPSTVPKGDIGPKVESPPTPEEPKR